MFFKHKWLGIVILILIILVIVFVFRSKNSGSKIAGNGNASNTSAQGDSSTISWKAYKNPRDSYEISYPNSWTDKMSDSVVSFKSNNGAETSPDDVTMTISLIKPSDSEFRALADQFSKFYNGSEASDSGKIKLQNIMISGYPGLKLLQLPTKEVQDALLLYQVKYNNSYYLISFASFSEGWWGKNSAVVTRIVESFKLPSSEASPTP